MLLVEKYRKEAEALRTQLAKAKDLFAQFYQVLGAHDANENALDAALAASDGNFDFELCPYMAEVNADDLQEQLAKASEEIENLNLAFIERKALCRQAFDANEKLSKELAKANESVKYLEGKLYDTECCLLSSNDDLAKANERVADLEQEKNKYFESLCMHAQRIPESDWIHNKDAVALLNKFAIEKKIEGVNWFSEKYCDDEHSFLADKAIEQLRKEQSQC